MLLHVHKKIPNKFHFELILAGIKTWNSWPNIFKFQSMSILVIHCNGQPLFLEFSWREHNTHNDSPDDCSKEYKLLTTDNDLFPKAFFYVWILKVLVPRPPSQFLIAAVWWRRLYVVSRRSLGVLVHASCREVHVSNIITVND